MKHALQVQHEHCYFHELKQVPTLAICKTFNYLAKHCNMLLTIIYTHQIYPHLWVVCNIMIKLLMKEFFWIASNSFWLYKETFSNDANGAIDPPSPKPNKG